MAILTEKPPIVGPGFFAKMRNFRSVLRAPWIAAAITGSFIARMTSSSPPVFRTMTLPEGRSLRPAARAAPRISANPLAVRPDENWDDMASRFLHRARGQARTGDADRSTGVAARFKDCGRDRSAAGEHNSPQYLHRHGQ